MIVLSLVLVVASAAALGWGIATTSEQLVWGSLLAGLAAVALVASSVVRHRRRETAGTAVPTDPATPGPPVPAGSPPAARPWSTGSGAAAPDASPSDASSPHTAPAGVWPWPSDASGPAADRSGWTGPVRPEGPVEAAGTAVQPTPEAAQSPAAQSPVAQSPVAQSPVAQSPVAQSPAVAGLGAATDRPLGEPFPEPPAAEPPADDGEPPVEDVPVRDALRVAQLDDSVQVVDGHPRYHLEDCPTLAGAEPMPLPVSAARRGGFTPCAICGPDRALLARAQDRRGGSR